MNTKPTKVGFVVAPCPVIVDEFGQAFSPVRTNQFPISQLTLASSIESEETQPFMIDLRSITQAQQWRNFLFKEYEHPIQYGDTLLHRYIISDFKSRLQNYPDDMDIYALTANFTFEANAIAETIKALKVHNSNASIIVGGRDASARPEFYRSAGAHFIGMGNGDESLLHFIKAYRNGRLAEYKNGLIHEMPAGKEMTMPTNLNVFNKPLIKHVESGGGLLFKTLARRGSYAYMQTTCGCPHNCSYCTESDSIRRAPLTQIFEAIDNYKDNNISTIGFIDANLLILRKEKDICAIFDYLRQSGMAWEFPSGIEVQQLFTVKGEPKKALMDAIFWNNANPEDFSGLVRVLVPFEDSLLKTSSLKKLSRVHHNRVLEELISRKVPYVNLAIMIGAPDETEQNRSKLKAHLDDIYFNTIGEPMHLNFSVFCVMPLPGTRQYAQVEKENRMAYDINTYPELWNVFCSVLRGDNFEAEETTAFREQLLNKFGMEQNSGKIALQYNRAAD